MRAGAIADSGAKLTAPAAQATASSGPAAFSPLDAGGIGDVDADVADFDPAVTIS